MTITANDQSAATGVRRGWPALTALAGATLLASLGISIASVALPTLAHAFSASIPDIQWVVLAYLISATVTVVAAGWFGDLFGHRRVLIAGLGIFAIASVLCATAPTLAALIGVESKMSEDHQATLLTLMSPSGLAESEIRAFLEKAGFTVAGVAFTHVKTNHRKLSWSVQWRAGTPSACAGGDL